MTSLSSASSISRATTPEAYRLIHEGAVALAHVEAAGIRVDEAYVDRTRAELGLRVQELESELREHEVYGTWRREYGRSANLGSGAQLEHVLFDCYAKEARFRTTPSAKHPQGQRSTSEEALEHLIDEGDAVAGFLEKFFRSKKIAKAKATYLDNLSREVVDGVFHALFNLHTARSHRSSSGRDKDEDRSERDFNFQNIPVRNPEIGRLVRQAFIPRPGHVIGEIDLGRIEVFVAFFYNRDPVLGKYLRDPTTDMHRDQAAVIFKLRPDQVSSLTRYMGKNGFVFPEFYGAGWFQQAPILYKAIKKFGLRVKTGPDDKAKTGSGVGLYEHLAAMGITTLGDCTPGGDPAPGTFAHAVREAERDLWERRFVVYTAWKKRRWQEYLEAGGFGTLTGFWIEGDMRRNVVINIPIQGVAFQILLWALTRLWEWLRDSRKRTRIVGQIHDSLVLDGPPSEMPEVLRKAKYYMTEAVRHHWPWIDIPLEAEAEMTQVDESWYHKKAFAL